MNKSVSTLIRLSCLALLVTMSMLLIISCDKLPFDNIFGGDKNDGTDSGDTPACEHANVYDSKCLDCGEYFITNIGDLSTKVGAKLPAGSATTQMYFIKASVKELLNENTGAMIIEDATGSINVSALYNRDGITYAKMEKKPDECDQVLLHCIIENAAGTIRIKTAFVIEHTAVEAPENNENPDNPADGIVALTVAEALELCGEPGNLTTERYYVRGTVKTVTNPAYGAMVIYDETGEIEVYGTYSADGSISYAEMSEKPVKGDEVLLYCTLQNYNGTKEIKNAWLIEFTHVDVPFEESNYTEMSIAEAREADTGALVKVSGVVAQITYANGRIPSGVILVDGTSSIYVYNGDIAGQVNIGNTITVAAEKTFWVLGTEASSAEKFGYKGANQLDSATLLKNDGGNTTFDKSWITETTVKEIMDTPVSEDITNKIFKVTALVKKAPGNGFTNYYIDDIDGVTGSYVYTQCNGSDFEWLDEFDGKFCTVYVVAINAKSSSSGCVWRFLPISVSDEGYTFDINDAPKYAVIYHGLGQFQTEYTGDPAAELITGVSSELLGFEGATLSYTSSNEEIVYFTEADGVVTLHCGKAGEATVTVTAAHGENSYSQSVVISVAENEDIDYISVADAIATPYDTDIVVKGIVGPSLVNQQGFYFFGEDGSMIAVKLDNADAFNGLAIGHEIIITGMRERYIKDDTYTTYGQDVIVNAVIVANYYGSHDYPETKIITDKTLADLAALNVTESHSTELYRLTVTVEVVEAQYYSNIYIVDGSTKLLLYCNSSSQYSWLKPYNGQTVTVEVAPCNWNEKTNYRGCVLAVVNEDGSKVYNILNFN